MGTLPRAENRRDTLPKEKNDDEDAMKAGTFTVGASTLSGTGVRRIGAAASRSGSAASRLQGKFLTRSRFEVVARAEEEDSKGAMADIGLGDLEDVMEKASGGLCSEAPRGEVRRDPLPRARVHVSIGDHQRKARDDRLHLRLRRPLRW